MDLDPRLTVEILFGETNYLEVSIGRLREINEFVRNKVIPRFTDCTSRKPQIPIDCILNLAFTRYNSRPEGEKVSFTNGRSRQGR